MSENNGKERSHGRRRHKGRRKSFVIIPVLFCVLIFAAGAGVYCFGQGSAVAALEEGIEKANTDRRLEYEDIFDVSQEPENGDVQSNTANPVYPEYGQCFGKLAIGDCGVNAKLFYGGGYGPLKNGAAVCSWGSLPGEGGIVAVTGHNDTYLTGLNHARQGQKVNVSTSFGDFVYEITSVNVTDTDDESAFNNSSEEETLVIFTYYPFDDSGITEQRYCVYAKYISGPDTLGQEG